MSFEPRDYLSHILAEADYLLATSEGLSFTDFVANETLQRAFVRSLEIIGEAAKKVPDSFRADRPDIEWRAMTGMRDRLIHDYFGVDYEIVWDAAQNHIPELRWVDPMAHFSLFRGFGVLDSRYPLNHGRSTSRPDAGSEVAESAGRWRACGLSEAPTNPRSPAARRH
ncbi:MAG: DUF86 domain-containing protein [Gemmatimonadota bacterium]